MYSKRESRRVNRQIDKQAKRMGLTVSRILIDNPQNNSLRAKQSDTGIIYPEVVNDSQ